MQKNIYVLWLLMLVVFVGSCIQPPSYPVEPEITYLGINKNTISQGAVPDTLIVNFEFTDGDGDLSTSSDNPEIDIFFTDNRQGSVSVYKYPLIADEGTANGISGDVFVNIPNTIGNICCIYSNGDNPCSPHPGEIDTFSFSIQIKDRADNYSNIIETEPIYILCD
jgi:hypothetical protein